MPLQQFVYMVQVPHCISALHAAGKVLGRTDIGVVITGQLLDIGLPPPRVYSGGHVAVGHVVCRLSVRSTDPAVIEPVSVDPARWIEELCGRTMVEGINAGMSSLPEK